MATLLSRKAILTAARPCIDITVPEWGDGAVVRARQMSTTERAEYLETVRVYQHALEAWEADQKLPEKKRKNLPKPEEIQSGILAIVRSLVDEDGNRLFQDEDMPQFADMSFTATTRVFAAIQKLNQFRDAPVELILSEKKG